MPILSNIVLAFSITVGGEWSLLRGAPLGWLSSSLRQGEGTHAEIGAGSRGEGLLSIDGSLEVFATSEVGRTTGERELPSWSEWAFDVGERVGVFCGPSLVGGAVDKIAGRKIVFGIP